MTQKDEMLLEIMKLSEPYWDNIHPKIQWRAITMFRRGRFKSTPKYDWMNNSIVCGEQSVGLKWPRWETLPTALIAKILVYCIYVPKSRKNRGHQHFDYPFAERQNDRLEQGLVCTYRLNTSVFARHDASIHNLDEKSFFFEDESFAFAYQAQGKELQRLVAEMWAKVVADDLIGNTELFHRHPQRTIEQVRAKLKIPEGVVIRDRLEQVLCRAVHIDQYSYNIQDIGHPNIRFSGMVDGVFISVSTPLPTDARYEYLFYKFGIYERGTRYRVEDLLTHADHQWKLRHGCLTKGKNGIRAPMTYPIVGANTYPAQRKEHNPDHVWTGRMRFYRTWLYEYRNLDDDTTGFHKASDLHIGNTRDICALYCREVGVNGTTFMVAFFCDKVKEWTYFGELLEQMYTCVRKPRGADITHRNREALEHQQLHCPSKTWTFPWQP